MAMAGPTILASVAWTTSWPQVPVVFLLTWRIIPGLVSVVNNHGDRKSPKWGYSPYKWPKWLINRG